MKKVGKLKKVGKGMSPKKLFKRECDLDYAKIWKKDENQKSAPSEGYIKIRPWASDNAGFAKNVVTIGGRLYQIFE